jgi:hypothetical protein
MTAAGKARGALATAKGAANQAAVNCNFLAVEIN